MYTYDVGAKKPVHCIPFDAPFSSVAFKDDGQTVAVGTNSGRVVFYDIRGKPQPFTVLRAYSSSEVGHLSPFDPYGSSVICS
jgi:protein NEDD1